MGILFGSFMKLFGVMMMLAMISSASLRVEAPEGDTLLKTIRDKSFRYEGEEQKTPFFENETNVFYFNEPIEEYVTVVYKDDTTQRVGEALRDGKIVPEDLEYYGVEYFTESKVIEEIIDLTRENGLPTASALDWFYSDDRFSYCFPSLVSEYIMVHFKDGTEQNFVEALDEGKVLVKDLEQFGIQYYAQIHGDGSYINHPGK